VAVMRHGLLLEQASRQAIFHEPLHPYTRSLLAAVPTMRTDLEKPLAMAGDPQAPRSQVAHIPADWSEPPLREAAPGHWARV
jgi:peptide/nickel transport system ATP-binding protein